MEENTISELINKISNKNTEIYNSTKQNGRFYIRNNKLIYYCEDTESIVKKISIGINPLQNNVFVYLNNQLINSISLYQLLELLKSDNLDVKYKELYKKIKKFISYLIIENN